MRKILERLGYRNKMVIAFTALMVVGMVTTPFVMFFGFSANADCQVQVFGGGEEARAGIKLIDSSTGVIYHPGDTVVIPAGSKKEFTVEIEVGEGIETHKLTYSCPAS